MDDPQDRRTNDAYINEQLKAIREDLHQISHGNGRQGLRQLLDDMYGPRTRERPGLFARVVIIENDVESMKASQRERVWLQRGIAVGMALVLAEQVMGVNIGGILRTALGL